MEKKTKKEEHPKEPYVAPTVTVLEIRLEKVIANSVQARTTGVYQDDYNDAGDFTAGGDAGSGTDHTFEEMD
jgi:hypothetical protein